MSEITETPFYRTEDGAGIPYPAGKGIPVSDPRPQAQDRLTELRNAYRALRRRLDGACEVGSGEVDGFR